ncbi:MAG: molybdopterin synthase catalytic subunit MoaE [Betaproteobacteria bacterium]|jgi:molybdopterin synthase catalytic subunit|nr:MAG: molybdopterin synthase catalytic subunit MoaE [Betaproteobacteria bacterium]
MTIKIAVQAAPFDLGAEIAALHRDTPAVGAVASFLGTVRNEAGTVSEMCLEHYPGMTEKALAEIVQNAQTRWALHSVTVIHRIGPLAPCDPIVMVAVASAHRDAAFAACAFIMDFLKTQAPFWKQETTADGAHWVDAKDSDTGACARWAAPDL